MKRALFIIQLRASLSERTTPVPDEQPTSRPASRQQTPKPASRPQTPQRTALNQSATTPYELNQSGSAPPDVVQSEIVQVAPAAQSEDLYSPVGSTTVSETQMNTVSEGEWILKSDGQLTPTGNTCIHPYRVHIYDFCRYA